MGEIWRTGWRDDPKGWKIKENFRKNLNRALTDKLLRSSDFNC